MEPIFLAIAPVFQILDGSIDAIDSLPDFRRIRLKLFARERVITSLASFLTEGHTQKDFTTTLITIQHEVFRRITEEANKTIRQLAPGKTAIQAQLANRLAYKRLQQSYLETFLAKTAKMGLCLKIAEQRHCFPQEITDKDIEEDAKIESKLKETERAQLQKELLRQEKPKKPREKVRAEPEPTRAVQKSDEEEVTDLPIAPEPQRSYPLELMRRRSPKEHQRVTKRWKVPDCAAIRAFEKQYEGLSDREILFLRVCHFLPGTEKIFADPHDKKIYTFLTERGLGMVAQLEFRKETYYGVLYFGIGEDGAIFHRFFEPMEPSELEEAFGHVPFEMDPDPSELEWASPTKFTFEVSAERVITVKYPGEEHCLRVYPLRKDLLYKKVREIS